MRFLQLDRRPVLVALAGPNGAGKSTFYGAHLRSAGLRFVNADRLARELQLDAYDAARLAAAVREELVEQGERFFFETVFSDPVGDKLAFLQRAVELGYWVALCFIGLDSASLSGERVAMRVTQGGHDVPTEKLQACYPRNLANLEAAIRALPMVLVYDNSDLGKPFNCVAVFERGKIDHLVMPLPVWFEPIARRVSQGPK